MSLRWWRLLAVPVAAALVVVGGCAVGGGREASTRSTAVVVPPTSPPPVAPAPARAAGPLVGVVSDTGTAVELGRMDPRTLRPLPGPRLELEGTWPMIAVAPDRSLAVFGSEAGELAIVDLVRLRRLDTVRIGAPAETIYTWGWAGPSRLLLASTAQDMATEVLAVDLGARRLVRRQRIDGVVQAYARLPRGLALLIAPPNTIGPARLVLSDANATLRTAPLARINAGFMQTDSADGSGPRMEQSVPGLATDPAGRRVYVVASAAPLAEVDLASLEVTYHQLGRPASPLQRLARWWAPAAEAKIIAGPSRSALWLGDGQLAVTGWDGSSKGHHMEIPSGLELIDTATWTARRVDRHSSSAILVGGRLLAFGTAFGTGQNGANQAWGLTLYGPGDRQPAHLFGVQQVSWIQVNGDLAYVALMDANASNLEARAVLDLRSGRVLHKSSGSVPLLLVPDRT
jgi:hypothetical protein